MDILSHTLSGVAAGTAVATITPRGWKFKIFIIAICGWAGALPDIDALSLWSNFDKTFGQWLSLSHSGKEIYFGKLWYSHHAGMHSVVTALLVAVTIVYGVMLLDRKRKGQLHLNTLVLTFFGVLSAFLFHLLEDMPTPHCVWGGVNLFWPSSQYIGGYGKIWWWNNYDLFLIICSVIVVNCLILVIKQFRGDTPKYAGLAMIFLAMALMIGQMNSREFSYNYRGHTANYDLYEEHSKLEQRAILGDNVFSLMEWLDEKIPLNF